MLDVATGKELNLLQVHEEVSGAAFAPDAMTLTVWFSDHTFQEWELPAGKERQRFPFTEPGPPAGTALAFPAGDRNGVAYLAAVSPDGRLIAYGSQSRYLVLHDLATGKELRRMENLPDGVSALAFSADSKMLAWGGWSARPSTWWKSPRCANATSSRATRAGCSRSPSRRTERRLFPATTTRTVLVWILTGRLGAGSKR